MEDLAEQQLKQRVKRADKAYARAFCAASKRAARTGRYKEWKWTLESIERIVGPMGDGSFLRFYGDYNRWSWKHGVLHNMRILLMRGGPRHGPNTGYLMHEERKTLAKWLVVNDVPIYMVVQFSKINQSFNPVTTGFEDFIKSMKRR
jgi:hypothetical protein